jgi:glycogen operon protein
MAHAITGSAAQFQHDGRGPRSSINHVTVHDGFTLADLVSYEHKHNEANGENNRDGSDDNVSTNCGAEGPTDDETIVTMRRQLRRNQFVSLLLAQGVPLILAGDEVANSQNGNNNAYCQDNPTGWVDWSKAGTDDDLSDFIGMLVEMRQRFAQLKPHRWLEGRKADGSYDVKWLTPGGAEMEEQDWNFPDGRFLSFVLAGQNGDGAPLYVVLNGADEEMEITLPEWPDVGHWLLLFDTGNGESDGRTQPAGEKVKARPRTAIAYAGPR